MPRIISATPLPEFRVALIFEDQAAGIVDLAPLAHTGVFEIWRQAGVFEQVRVGPVGELVWCDTIDLCPDALYLQMTHQQPEDIFPLLGV